MSDENTNTLKELGFDLPNHWVTGITTMAGEANLGILFIEAIEATAPDGTKFSAHRNVARVTMPIEAVKKLHEALTDFIKEELEQQ